MLRLEPPAVMALFAALAAGPLAAAEVGTTADTPRPSNQVSPARQIEPPLGRPSRGARRRQPTPDLRSLDGSGNNVDASALNQAGTPLFRIAEPEYADGLSTLAGPDRPSPRLISNVVHDQGQNNPIPNLLGTSDMLWQWGQFLDHDIDLTEGVDPPEPAPIPVPESDPFFDPSGTGSEEIPFNRSTYDPDSGTDPNDPRRQLNLITGWIDASNVYGSDDERAMALRMHDGNGRLRTSEGNLLPPADPDFPLATGGQPLGTLFFAGDVRANEQVGLTAMHTLFVREHNRLAAEIAAHDPTLSGGEIYERARRLVGAQMQVITYREFLPALLGPGALPPYRGYDPSVEPRIANEFSTAAYRFGHSALSPTLLRLDANLEGDALPLRHAFFNPELIRTDGIDGLLRGLVHQLHQRVDVFVIEDVRNFLFGLPGQGGSDLASLNIQRGRDHGLPGYNAMRQVYGFAPAADFADISSDPEVQARLAEAYTSVDSVDVWTGGLAEDAVRGSHLGPLFRAIVAEQFTALRDGDRLFYQRVLTGSELGEVERTRLSDVIRRNTEIGFEIPDDVFRVPRRGGHRR